MPTTTTTQQPEMWDCWSVNSLYVGDSNPSLKNLVQLGLIQQLWVSGLVRLQFYCHFLEWWEQEEEEGEEEEGEEGE